jgi:hypothetical protein
MYATYLNSDMNGTQNSIMVYAFFNRKINIKQV